MTTKELMENVIKAHVKDRKSMYTTYYNVKGLKVLNVSTLSSGTTLFKRADGDYVSMTKYFVECSIKAKKYENNILYFNVLIYDELDSEIEVFYFGETYRD